MTRRSLAELLAAAKWRVLLCAASAVVALGGWLRHPECGAAEFP